MEISGLLWGTYYLEEVNTPAGLIAGEDIVVSVTDQSKNPIIDLEVTNKLNTGSLSFGQGTRRGGVQAEACRGERHGVFHR